MKDYSLHLVDNKLTIFLFHGVIPDNARYAVRNYNRKHIHESYFRDIMKSLSNCGTAISINDIVSGVYAKEGAKKPFIVSFDDGFRNNKTLAAPILQELNIPAVFYITTGFVEHNEMSWIDKIEWLFENIEDEHRIQVSEKEILLIDKDPASKIFALNSIRKHVKQSRRINTRSYVNDIFQQVGKNVISESCDVLDEKLSWDDVVSLNRNDLFTIGGHTHSHAIMSYISDEELQNEVDTSVSLLEKHIGVAPEHYSYPEGQEEHYNEETIAVLKSRGIKCCPSAIEGVNTYPLDLFNLNRIMVL